MQQRDGPTSVFALLEGPGRGDCTLQRRRVRQTYMLAGCEGSRSATPDESESAQARADSLPCVV